MRKSTFRFFLLFGFIVFLFTQCNVLAPISSEESGSHTNKPGTTQPKPPKMDKEALLRADILDYAKEYLGTEYKYAGRDPKKGFDCSGFTYFVMLAHEIILSPSSRAQENQGKRISVKDVQAGDLIFYRRSANTDVFHVSLVVSNTSEGIKVIHSTSRGVVIDNISTSSYWNPKISTARDVVSGKF